MIQATNQPFRDTGYDRLQRVIGEYDSLVVAYSGGVDSGLLAYAAWRVLGERMLAVLGLSPSLGLRERTAAEVFLASHSIPHLLVETREMSDPRYRSNNPDRCYFCKAELFGRLREVADERGFRFVAHGANLDDRGDHRPGARAASENGVCAPLVDAGMTKELVRSTAQELGLTLWDKPAAPCLVSRIPYYHPVTEEKLRQVEEGEVVLKDLGFSVCRVRHYGAVARIEVPMVDHERLLRPDVWQQVVRGLTHAGFEDVVAEVDGFRSGRLNDVL